MSMEVYGESLAQILYIWCKVLDTYTGNDKVLILLSPVFGRNILFYLLLCINYL